ncbi:MAG TPA: Glu/Leu/Phe/Val dehydrogenase dimerization domain-containing protein [Actinomycetota bacterium]|nr:Glu/Leu/Phe/Val dehydrogenase dimerization domain-containing protein [Actinomycetota bacterium]
MFEDLLRAWDGEEVAVRFDAPTGTWMFVCVHSTVLGPAAGGTRLKVYEAPEDALRDGLRLSTAMTSKNAMAGLPLGGGKAVLAVPELPAGAARREVLLRYGDLVESLHGTYWTACDMNTSPPDMDVIGERSSHVFARTEAAGGSGTSAPATAEGVIFGMRAALRHAFGDDGFEGRTVAIQGVGAVGDPLARALAEAGARLVLADVDDVRAKEIANELGGSSVDAKEIVDADCDVFSPCATGGVLSGEVIAARLRCRVVAGAANNQLAEPEDADRLAERGILYAPDYVVNAGGIIHLASLELLGEDLAARDERVRAIGDTLREVFRVADERGISTAAAADAIVEQRLDAGRGVA